ncbi:MAG: AmmeMemoRadiSam system protein B [Parcubacteria group bacterium]
MALFKKQLITIGVLIIASIFLINMINLNSRQTPLHYSSPNTKNLYESAFKKTNTLNHIPTQTAQGAIVNHHLLADHFIANVFENIKRDEIETVILLSPNHFYKGVDNAITTNGKWSTPYGILKPDKSIIQNLSDQRIITIDPEPFENEHGISNIVGFIKHELPQVKIAPIILRESISQRQKDDIISFLSQLPSKSTLFIASVDFSHEVTPDIARSNDEQSLEIIQSFDFENIREINIDSIASLEILMKTMDNFNAKKFTVLEMSNAGELINDPILEDTTSYITGYFTK